MKYRIETDTEPTTHVIDADDVFVEDNVLVCQHDGREPERFNMDYVVRWGVEDDVAKHAVVAIQTDDELLDVARELVAAQRAFRPETFTYAYPPPLWVLFQRLADIVAARDAAGPQPDPWPVVKAARELVEHTGREFPDHFVKDNWIVPMYLERARLLSALRAALAGLPATETQDDEVANLRAELAAAQQLVCDFQAAALLDVDGDSSEVTPLHAEDQVTRLRDELNNMAEKLDAANAALDTAQSEAREMVAPEVVAFIDACKAHEGSFSGSMFGYLFNHPALENVYRTFQAVKDLDLTAIPVRTPEEQAVIDAAKVVRRYHNCSRADYRRNPRDGWYRDDIDGPFLDAVDALNAAEAGKC